MVLLGWGLGIATAVGNLRLYRSRSVKATWTAWVAAAMLLCACSKTPPGAITSCQQLDLLQGPSTTDILFVVDDSGSMDSKQQALATNFDTFINAINTANATQVSKGLEPFDFHISVTTSSIFSADTNGKQCVLNGGKTQCCSAFAADCLPISSCVPGDVCGSGGRCIFERSGITVGTYPPVSFSYQCCTSVSNCSDASCFPGDVCPAYTTSYTSFSDCTQGVAQLNGPYPSGGLVAATGNPKVLHFTKNLYTSNPPNTTAINALLAQFKQNIQVGSCGSNEEQHFEAGRLAMQMLLGGSQTGVTSSDWPHLGAKLIVVFVGDEDDCSSPTDPSKSIVLVHGEDLGADECVADKNLPTQNQVQAIPVPNQIAQRAFPVSDYDAFFASLITPIGQQPTVSQPYSSVSAAFIDASLQCTNPSSSYPLSYAPADDLYLETPLDTSSGAGNACIEPPQFACSVAYAAGVRHLELAQLFIARGYSVVLGSVCENFGPILANVAGLLNPGQTLALSGTPADWQLLSVSVLKADGTSVACQVGDTAGSGDVLYVAPTASQPASLVFGGPCTLQPGDQATVKLLCVG